MVDRFGLGAGAAGRSRSPATTATCCSTSRRAASRCSASSPRRTSPRRRGGRHPEPGRASSARRRRRRSRPRASARRPAARQQRARARPRPQRFRRGLRASCSRRRACVTMEFPHLLRLMDENQFDTIYHEHYSYLSFCAVERVFAAHGLDGLRRRGAADARRLACAIYACHEDDATRRCRPRASPSCRDARTPSARLDGATTTRFADAGPRRPSASCSVPDRGQASAGKPSPAMAPRPRATRCSTTAASGRLPRLHGRPQPAQAGPLPARHAHPDLRPGARSARRGPTTS